MNPDPSRETRGDMWQRAAFRQAHVNEIGRLQGRSSSRPDAA